MADRTGLLCLRQLEMLPLSSPGVGGLPVWLRGWAQRTQPHSAHLGTPPQHGEPWARTPLLGTLGLGPRSWGPHDVTCIPHVLLSAESTCVTSR